MSIKSTSPGGAAGRPAARGALRWPSPDRLVWLLLVVIAMIAAALVGLSLGTI